MNAVPLEDQLRSMILKNGGGQGPSEAQAAGKYPTEPSSTQTSSLNHPANSAPLSQRPAPPPQTPFQGPLPDDSPHNLPAHGHLGFHDERSQPNARQHRHHALSPQAPPGFTQQRRGNGHVPPHMRNRTVPSGYVQQEPDVRNAPPSQNFQRFRMGPHGRGHPGSPAYPRGPMNPSPQITSHLHPRGSLRGPGQRNSQLFDPYANQRQQFLDLQQKQASVQSDYLSQLAAAAVSASAMTDSELNEKLEFVSRLQDICQAEIHNMPNMPQLEFKCFGSIGTGFVTKGSDIDLAVIAHNHDDTESARKYGPRTLEKIFLDKGFGARLLTNTRVPIIKFCQKPSPELLENLRAERKKWDDLPEEEKVAILEGIDKISDEDATEGQDEADITSEANPLSSRTPKGKDNENLSEKDSAQNIPQSNPQILAASQTAAAVLADQNATQAEGSHQGPANHEKRDSRQEKPWLREKPLGPLDFPKDSVGILCDLNFAGHLGIYNTRLLHCYATSDQRVRDMVIFIKTWAKKRKINSSYNGTLSSYGYTLMVLHYLMRVPSDPVVQDLQSPLSFPSGGKIPDFTDVVVQGQMVRFFSDEDYIQDLKQKGYWSQNRESLGALLRGFFSYYGRPGIPDRVGGFHWTRDVITFGQRKPWERMVTKGELGWTKARVEKNSKKEVRHRYLLCIQDPFELDHNVGRTVSHQGICAIREEFRRAWRILEDVSQGKQHKDFFASIEDDPPQPQFFGNNNNNNNNQQSGRKDEIPSRRAESASTNNPTHRSANANHGDVNNKGTASDPTPAEAMAMNNKQRANASESNPASKDAASGTDSASLLQTTTT